MATPETKYYKIRQIILHNIKSSKCPICGAEKVLIINGIERDPNDTIWIRWEEICENRMCKYDKIYRAKFFPNYEGLEREYLG
jgi:hypothetical protein